MTGPMVFYNGYEVYPQQLRTRATGYTSCGESVETVKKHLQEQLGDGSYIGHDKYATAFLKNYGPLLERIWTMLDQNAQGLHGVRHGLDTMATTYEQADQAGIMQV